MKTVSNNFNATGAATRTTSDNVTGMSRSPTPRRRATLASLAAELKVSRTTISNAYNRPDQLSADLRERVLATAKRLGYPGPDPVARSLRTRKAGAVGLVMTEPLNYSFSDPAALDFVAGLAESCEDAGQGLLLVAVGPNRSVSDGSAAVLSAGVDGFVVYSASDDDPYLQVDLFEYERAGDPEVWVALAPRGRYGVDFELNIPTPFIGRDHELALLTDVYARVLLESAPHVVTIVGPAGAGKSRLLSEFWNVLDGRPELVYWRQGRSLGDDAGVTLWALGEVVKGQAGILESDDFRTARASSVRRSGRFLPGRGRGPADREPCWRRSPAWCRRTPARCRTPSRSRPGCGSWRRWRRRIPWCWCSRTSTSRTRERTAFVQFLSERAAGVPMLVVCTARLEVLDRERPWTPASRGRPARPTITLGPLSERDTGELVAWLGGPADRSGTPPVELLQAAGGNPLYVESYVRLVSEEPESPNGARPGPSRRSWRSGSTRSVPASARSSRTPRSSGRCSGRGRWKRWAAVVPGRSPRACASWPTGSWCGRPGGRRSPGSPSTRSGTSPFGTPPPSTRIPARWAARPPSGGDVGGRHGRRPRSPTMPRSWRSTPGARTPARRTTHGAFLRLAAGRAALLDPARAAGLYARAAALEAEGSPEREELGRRAAEAARAAEDDARRAVTGLRAVKTRDPAVRGILHQRPRMSARKVSGT